MFKRLIACFVIFCFSCTLVIVPQAKAAETVLDLPVPGTMVNLSPAYEPALIKGLTIHKDNPFLFDFIIDTGNEASVQKQEADRLIKYFFACLTIPEKNLWVNLSPYEKDRMIPQALGQTALGRDLLSQDYILKQLTASLIYPEKNLGKEFWNRVYAKAQEMYGTNQIPVNTFNKVWIVADKASVYEHGQTAFIVSGHLRVMLEEDYLALSHHVIPAKTGIHNLASNIVRQIILPEIEKEVNTGKNFAMLRQIFYSQILAVWFKRNLKEALINQIYANKSTVKGIDQNDIRTNEAIYQQYLKAYKKGAFNYIKEEPQADGQAIPRKYFSGGYNSAQLVIDLAQSVPENALTNPEERVTVALSLNSDISPNAAMTSAEARDIERALSDYLKQLKLEAVSSEEKRQLLDKTFRILFYILHDEDRTILDSKNEPKMQKDFLTILLLQKILSGNFDRDLAKLDSDEIWRNIASKIKAGIQNKLPTRKQDLIMTNVSSARNFLAASAGSAAMTATTATLVAPSITEALDESHAIATTTVKDSLDAREVSDGVLHATRNKFVEIGKAKFTALDVVKVMLAMDDNAERMDKEGPLLTLSKEHTELGRILIRKLAFDLDDSIPEISVNPDDNGLTDFRVKKINGKDFSRRILNWTLFMLTDPGHGIYTTPETKTRDLDAAVQAYKAWFENLEASNNPAMTGEEIKWNKRYSIYLGKRGNYVDVVFSSRKNIYLNGTRDANTPFYLGMTTIKRVFHFRRIFLLLGPDDEYQFLWIDNKGQYEALHYELLLKLINFISPVFGDQFRQVKHKQDGRVLLEYTVKNYQYGWKLSDNNLYLEEPFVGTLQIPIGPVQELLNTREEQSASAAMINVRTNVINPLRGGIDLSNTVSGITVTKDANGGVKVDFDPAMIARIRQEGVQSAVPVIINITPMSPAQMRPLLGLNSADSSIV